MSIFNKLKNVLFEDVTEEIPIYNEEKKEETVKEVVKQEEIPRFREVKEEINEPIREEVKDLKFKNSEDSPVFQQFDEEEFDRIAAINKNRLIERDRKLREEKEKTMSNLNNYDRISHSNQISREQKTNYKDSFSAVGTIKKEDHAPKKFTPSPVISPVYGILDKNYKKEDILPRASSDGTLPKVIDVDSVRKKAFGTLEEDIENINDEIINDNDNLIKTSEIKITSYDDDYELSNNDYLVDDVEEDKVNISTIEESSKEVKTRSKKNKTIEELEKELEEHEEIESKEEKENNLDNNEVEDDLLDLIDSMYKED